MFPSNYSIQLLAYHNSGTSIDIASATSPYHEIISKLYSCTSYRQDMIYPLGVHDFMIGGNATELPFEDNSINWMTLHCSFEHFENEDDSKFIVEAIKKLTLGGKLYIAPLYLSDVYCNYTDPDLNVKDVHFDRDAKMFFLSGWKNRFGRAYDVDAFQRRVLAYCKGVDVSIYFIENLKDICDNCYLNFIFILEKTNNLKEKKKEKLNTKEKEELDFWINVWNKKIIDTGCWTEDVYSLIGEEKRIDSYEKQREKEGKAQGYRILSLAKWPRDYFDDKVVIEIGPGCCGLLEMSNARTKIAIEPLAEQFRNNNLLLKNDRGALYLTSGAESIPLMSEYADIVIASNCLDHVNDLIESITEIHRVLKISGEVFVNVEIDHPPTECEPHSLSYNDIVQLFKMFRTVFIEKATNDDGRKWVRAVFKKVAS